MEPRCTSLGMEVLDLGHGGFLWFCPLLGSLVEIRFLIAQRGLCWHWPHWPPPVDRPGQAACLGASGRGCCGVLCRHWNTAAF